jgi:hypothetical protein
MFEAEEDELLALCCIDGADLMKLDVSYRVTENVDVE